jgi:uncharacterized membrane protein YbhN (UPF0104 family)
MRAAVVGMFKVALGSPIRIHHVAALSLPVAFLFLLLLLPEEALAGRVSDGVRTGLDGIGAADGRWLILTGLLLALSLSGSALAWRGALRACGVRCTPVDAVARYGIGSLANAALPAKLGGVIRIALFSRLVEREGAIWTTGGAAAVAGAVRALWLGMLVAAASTSGVLPAWPAFALVGVGCVGVLLAPVARRTRWHARAAHALDAFRALARRPRAAVTVVASVGLAVIARVAAASTLALAFDVGRPLAAGLLIVAAVELAAVLPLSPSSAGMAGAAVAFALTAHGAGGDVAVAAGITFAAVETATSIVTGSLGALVLTAPALARIAARPAQATVRVE